MWYPVKFKASNFMSYEELTYKFVRSIVTLVYGKNLDEPGADSNGSGKSAIVKGVTISLLGVPDKSLTQEDYIMDYTERCDLEFHLVNKVHNMTLQINRVFRRGKESQVFITENGVLNEKLTSVNEANKRILELLDIKMTDVLNYYIINQENSNSFFESTDSAQKSTISRFVNADLVDLAIDKIQVDIKNLIAKISRKETEIEIIDTRIATLQGQIEYETNERLSSLTEEKTKYETNIQSNIKKISESKKHLRDYQIKLEELNESLNGLPKIDYNIVQEIEARIDVNKVKKQDANKALLELEREFRNIELLLSGEITCPKCKHKWVEASETSPASLRMMQSEYKQLISNVNESTEKLEERIEKLKEKLTGLSEVEDKYEEIKQEISRNNRKLKGHEQTIEDLISETNSYKKSLNVLSSGINNTRIADLEKDIIEEDSKKQSIMDEILELRKQKEDLSYWNINMGIKGFKTFLINKTLQSLEGYVNLFLTKFNTNLIVRIQGFKTLKSGDVRENITITISRDGGDTWRPFKRHSGGQRKRINVCGILTLQSQINNSSKYGGIDLLILDEFFEGLDQRGQKGVLKILEAAKITTLVISHNNNDINLGNQVRVTYKNGKSTLYEKIESSEGTKGESSSSGKKKVKAAA